MDEELHRQAKLEIDSSLYVINFCLKFLGVAFNISPKSFINNLRSTFIYGVSFFTIVYHTFSDVVYMGILINEDPRIENFVSYFHTFGYGVLSSIKLYALRSKKNVFGQLLQELVYIWPTKPLDTETLHIKETRLNILHLQQITYSILSYSGLVFYCLTPIASYYYNTWQGNDVKLGFIWACWYPFDKYSPIGHAVTYIFETFVGHTCVMITVSSDLLFMAMACHIGTLLRILQMRVRSINTKNQQDSSYLEVVSNIKLHQRLIRYCEDLESAFTVVNFYVVVFGSIDIGCVVFSIAFLDPLYNFGNKIFLVCYGVQILMMCWYADDICTANCKIADAAYDSNWYTVDVQCQKTLHILICRAQKPLGFTAYKFTMLTLLTYSTILSRSYSYFALLYSMYDRTEK